MSVVLPAFLEDIETLIGILTALALIGSWLFAKLRSIRRGNPGHRYIRWFVEQYGTYWNPYLDSAERLELDRTYIPLSFVQELPEPEHAVGATVTVADLNVARAIVVGDAGSGKTTMLMAYGVSLLRDPAGGSRRRRPREIPFFVPVRVLAGLLRQGGTLDGYLLERVLNANVGLTGEESRRFLAQTLQQNRCVVLLDGLDEVNPDDYQAVRDEVHRFTRNLSPELPTVNARFFITCRHHNFLRVRDDWVASPSPFAADRVYALAPLRDAEIVDYLHRFRDRFRRVDGPEYFLAAVRAARALHLHRNPLVLSMSVGLYASREAFEIPHSIAELYDAMIREMLGRHGRHGGDRGGANRFFRDDKQRLLQEFSLELAEGPTGFGPFDRAAMVGLSEQLQPKLRNVAADQVPDFVDEIIDRSGLLSVVTEQSYEFAHRSIQEHLVAAELLRAGDDGTRLLRERAVSREWRQVVLFFTAAADQRTVSPFLRELAMVDPVTAGSCLAGADCLDSDALPILDTLADMLSQGRADLRLPALAALLAATTSPRPKIQDAAKNLIHRCLGNITDEAGAVSALGGDVEGLLGIVSLLADGMPDASVSRTLVTRLIAIVPDDARLVEPLWRCLEQAAAGWVPDQDPDADQHLREIVERLLTLAMDRQSWAELQRQSAQQPAFATAELRRQVYPFRNGLDLSSNLVTLLCWADKLSITLPAPNRFLVAMAADRSAWARIETDRVRTGSVRLPGIRLHLLERSRTDRVVGWVLLALAVLVGGLAAVDLGRPDGALAPSVWAVVLLLVAAEGCLSLPLLGVQVRRGPERQVHLLRPNPFLDVYHDERSRHWLLPAGTETAPAGSGDASGGALTGG
ncbi:NACHT domain-containing protein [Micromonospora sp. CPCC 206060]|uniref:NACHT domain-containing protein n=1 Tax=Micromonospora sp. CPCC 206060 TaxID=3122406 RepID=UPI002FF154BC